MPVAPVFARVELHVRGVVHYDVKGDNVLLREGSGAALAAHFEAIAAAPAAINVDEESAADASWRRLLPFVCFADFGASVFRRGVPAASQAPATDRGTECIRAPEQLLLRLAAGKD